MGGQGARASLFASLLAVLAGIPGCSRTGDDSGNPSPAATETIVLSAISIGTVNDGTGADIDTQNVTDTISANWTGFSSDAGITGYEWAIGTSPGGTQIQTYTSVGIVGTATRNGLVLLWGYTYHVSVRATDGDGHKAIAISDGVQIVPAGPPVAGTVNDGAGADIDTQTSTDTISANWTGFSSDAGITGYEWAIGTSPGGTQIQTYTSVGIVGTATRNGLVLLWGYTYHVSVRATDNAGRRFIAISDGVQVAPAGPPVAGTVNDGTGADIDTQTSTDTISANWTGFSSDAGITGYEWAIGTSPGGTQIQTYTSVGIVGTATRNGLVLLWGYTYHVSVRATDNAGRRFIAISDGVQVVPSGSPVAGAVNDGAGADIDTQTSTDTISANWTGFSSDAGITGYEWAIGTSPGGTQIQTYTSVGIVGTATRNGLVLLWGYTYHVSVRATDNAGRRFIAISDGVQVAPAGPPVAGAVNDGTGADIDTQISTDTISANWTGFSSDAGITGYEWAIGTSPGGTQIQDYTSVGIVDLTATKNGLALSYGYTYHVSVRATDNAGRRFIAISDGVTIILTPAGSLVESFGTGGVVEFNLSTDNDKPMDMAIDSTYMYVIGDYYIDNDQEGWLIEKRSLSTGALDVGFGTGGTVTVDPSLADDEGRGIAIDGTHMYLVGDDHSTTNGQWHIEKRSLATGDLDATFGVGGVITVDLGGGSDTAYAIAIDGTYLYVFGTDSSVGGCRIEKRNLSDGALVAAFGTAGAVTTDPTAFSEIPRGIAVDSSSIYLIGTAYDSFADAQWWMEKRNLSDGALDTAFGTGGVAFSNPAVGNSDEPLGLAIDSTSMYVVGFDLTNALEGARWRIEKRSLATGILDTSFDGDGVVFPDPSTGSDIALDVVVDGTSLYVVGHDAFPVTGDSQWRIEKRIKSTGALDPAFDGDGVATSNPVVSGANTARVAAVDASFIYIAGTSGPEMQIRYEKRAIASAISAGIVSDGLGVDIGRQDSTTTISTNWTGFTSGVAITGYEWAIGTTPGGTDVMAFTTVGIVGTTATKNGLTLSYGYTYHVTIRATDALGRKIVAISNGVQVVPASPPVAGTVNDGLVLDVDTQNSTNTISANWSGFSSPAGITGYEWAIGTTPGATNILAFTSVGLNTAATANTSTGLPALTVGTTYHVTVRATDNAGQRVIAISDGVQVVSWTPATGMLDADFDDDGIVTTAVGIVASPANGVVIQPDGKIVAAGYCRIGDIYVFAVVRYEADGSLDMTFGGTGMVTTDFAGQANFAYAVALQPDGKIVVAGYATNAAGGDDIAVARYCTDGLLDATFDGDGRVLTDLGTYDGAMGVAVQADGKIVVAGYTMTGASEDMAVVRYKMDGSLDDTFGGDGKVTTAIGTSYDDAMAVAIQPDGKIVTAGFYSNGTYDEFALVRYDTDGALDMTFGGGGKVTTDFGSISDAYAIALQPDGKILAAGYARNPLEKFAMARYNADGSLDMTFGAGGKVVTSLGGANDYARAITLQPDGKIVASGYSYTGTTDDVALVRYNANGSLDTTFSGGGILTLDLAPIDKAYGVALQLDGKIVVVGESGDAALRKMLVLRYEAASYVYDGLAADVDNQNSITTISANWGGLTSGAGITAYEWAIGTTPGATNIQAFTSVGLNTAATNTSLALTVGTTYHVTVRATDALGRKVTATSDGVQVVSWTPATGVLDTDFGTGGIVTTPIGAGESSANDMKIQPDGKIVVAGSCSNGVDNDVAVARYKADGTLDDTFGENGGITTTDFGFDDRACALALQPDGKIVVAATNGGADFIVVRYDADGTRDLTFGGGDGILIIDVPGSGEPTGVLLQPDGKILLTGYANGLNYEFAVVRCNADGSLDTTFGGGDGIVTTHVSASDRSWGATLQADGKIVLVGDTGTHTALVRYTAAGELDTTFDRIENDGIVTTVVGTDVDSALAVAVQPDGKIVTAGWSSSDGDITEQFAVVRYDSDGALDATFGAGGIVITAVGNSYDCATQIMLQPDGKIVVVGSTYNGTNYDMAAVRYNTDGALDTTFSGDGKLTIDLGSNESLETVALQVDGKIVAAGWAGNLLVIRLESTPPAAGTVNDGLVLDADAQNSTTTISANWNGFSSTAGITGYEWAIGTTPGATNIQAFTSVGLNTAATANTSTGLPALTVGTTYHVTVRATDGIGQRVTAVSDGVQVVSWTPATGVLDTDFDGDGMVIADISGNDSYTTVAIQPDGKIVTAGQSAGAFAVVRYNPDGTLDGTFGGGGKALLGGSGQPYGIALQADGKIVVAGGSAGAGFKLVRYTATGSLDDSFDGDGIVLTSVPGGGDPYGVAVQADGKIVVVGYAGTDTAVVRYKADGSLDTTFGDNHDGIAITDAGTGADDWGNAIAIQPDGKIVVAGGVWGAASGPLFVARYTTGGSLDLTFGGGDGIATTAIGSFYDGAQALLLQPDGKIVAAGYSSGAGGSNMIVALVRYDATGTLDGTFGGGGMVTTNLPNAEDAANGIALQPDGKIVVAAFTTGAVAILRYNSNGSLDGTFDGDGILVNDVTGGNDVPQAVAIQTDGKIVVVGLAGWDLLVLRYEAVPRVYDGAGADIQTQTSTTTLSANWTGFTSGAGGITYEWAIGTTPGGTDVMAFTTAGIVGTTATKNGLALSYGYTYHVTIRATDALGRKIVAISNGVQVVPAGPPVAGTVNDGLVLDVDTQNSTAAISANWNGFSSPASITGYEWAIGTTPGATNIQAFTSVGLNTAATANTSTGLPALAVGTTYHVTVRATDSAGQQVTAVSDGVQVIPFAPTTGALDPEFDGDGMVSTAGSSGAHAVVIQPDGKIVVAAKSSNGIDDDFAVLRYNADGSPDLPFGGGDGIATTDIGPGTNDYAYAVALQADGKIVVAGSYGPLGSADWAVVRYNTDGTLDTTFAVDGKFVISLGSQDTATAVVVQFDGKIAVAGSYQAGVNNSDAAVVRLTSDGALDPDFGDGGIARTEVSLQSDGLEAIAQQPDGKLVVAGFAGNPTWEDDFLVIRYDTDGLLDTSFGDGGIGIVTTPIAGSAWEGAQGIALQPDGKIVATGYCQMADSDTALIRYDATGGLDTTFGDNGIVVTGLGGEDYPTSLVLQPDGKIAVAGVMGPIEALDVAVARYNADGSLDTTFGGDGKLSIDGGSGSDFAYAIALQVDGKLVVAADTGNVFVIRLDSAPLVAGTVNDGLVLDVDTQNSTTTISANWSGFSSGVAISYEWAIGTAPGAADIQAFAGVGLNTAATANTSTGLPALTVGTTYHVTVRATDGIGRQVTAVSDGVLVVPWTPSTGVLDTDFSGDGIATTTIGAGSAVTYEMAIQPDGKIVTVGSTSGGDFVVVRYDTNGVLDPAFGEGAGYVLTDFGLFEEAIGVVLQPDGKIVAAGFSGSDFAVARYNADGQLDLTFNGTGKRTTDIAGGTDCALGVALQADGKIVAGGYAGVGANTYFALVRYKADGSLDTTFDGDGKLTTIIGGRDDEVMKVAVQPDGKIVAGGYFTDAAMTYHFAAARYEADGGLDLTFHDDGMVTTEVGTSFDIPYALALQPDGKILMAGYANSGDDDIALVRYNPDGQLDLTFDGAGKLTTELGSNDYAYGLALQPDGKIIAAGFTSTVVGNDSALLRYNANGTLDTTFGGGDGILTFDLANDDRAIAVALQVDGRIVAAGYAGSDLFVLRLESAPYVYDGLGADVDNQSSITTISANWGGFTSGAGGITYEWAIGTAPGAADVMAFTAAGIVGTTATKNGLTLSYGYTYHVTIRATDALGQQTTKISDGVMVDMPVITAGTVNDGLFADADTEASTTAISANWSGFTSGAGIVKYEWAIGTAPGATDIQGWTDVGTSTRAWNNSLVLNYGITYHVTVRATDGAGQKIIAISDGVLVQPGVQILSRGGTGTTGNGGTGGAFDLTTKGGGDIRILTSGAVDASFASNTAMPDLGSNPITIAANTTLTPGIVGGVPRSLAGDSNPALPATGLWIQPGATLTLNVNEDVISIGANCPADWDGINDVAVDFTNGVYIEGTLTAPRTGAPALSGSSMRLNAANVVVASTGRIDLSAGDSTAAFTNSVGGHFHSSVTGSFTSAGTIDTTGGDNPAAYDSVALGGGKICVIASNGVYNLGTVDASGGRNDDAASPASNAGNAGEIRLLGTGEGVFNSGTIRAKGGNAQVSNGGNGGYIGLNRYYNSYGTTAAFRNSGTIDCSAGSSAVSGNGGSVTVTNEIYSNNLDIRFGGTFLGKGGNGAGAGSVGGDGAWLYVYGLGDTPLSVVCGATINCDAGSGSTGGFGGYFLCNNEVTTAYAAGKGDVSFVGYDLIDVSGGSTTGGSGGGSYGLSFSLVPNNGYLGGWINQVLIVARGGSSVSGNGGASSWYFATSTASSNNTHESINIGSLDLSGGNGANAVNGYGESIYLYDYYRLTNAGSIVSRGGTGSSLGGGAGGAVSLGDEFAPGLVTINSGTINTSGGAGATTGGAGGAAEIQAVNSTHSGGITTNGGNGGTGAGGRGGDVTIHSSSPPSTASGTRSQTGGSGNPNGDNGSYILDP